MTELPEGGMRGAEIAILAFLMDWIVGASSIAVNLFAIRLGATPFILGMLGFSWGIFYSTMTPLVGRISSRGRRKPMILLGISITLLSMILYGVSSKPLHLILISLISGLGCSLFWPVFETLLHVEGDNARTNKNMGFFNIGWTTGMTLGTATGGAMMALGPRTTFSAMAFVSGAILLFALLRVNENPFAPAQPHDPPQVRNRFAERMDVSRIRAFLYTSWIANFLVWFGTSTVATLFPKLGKSYGFSDVQVGLLSSLLNLGQAISFLALMSSSRWHFVFPFLLLSQILASLGIFLIGFLKAPLGLGTGLLLLGIGRGICYSSSLYYSLISGDDEGSRTGIHEMLIGSSFTIGPFLSGIIAQRWGLNTPFFLFSALSLLVLLLQPFIYGRLSRKGI